MREFKNGDKVFAKIRGFPEWPGKIVKNVGDNRYLVSFFPKGDTSVVKEECVHPFIKCVNKFGRAKNKLFQVALTGVLNDLNAGELKQLKNVDNHNLFKNYYSHLKVKEPVTKMIEPKKNGGERKRTDGNRRTTRGNKNSQPETEENTEAEKSEEPENQRAVILLKAVLSLRYALPFNKPPDTAKCLSSLDIFKNKNLTKVDLNICPIIVPTIANIRHYIPSSILGCKKNSENSKLVNESLEIRKKAEEIFHHIKSLHPHWEEDDILKKYTEKYNTLLKSL